MSFNGPVVCALALGFAVAVGVSLTPAWGDAGHGHGAAHPEETLDHMKEMHRGHRHGHDFEAMEHMSAEDQQRVISLMMDVGLALPPMDSRRGRELFLDKGCIVCHAVNRVGGTVGPALNAADMPKPMNAFEFAARMWRGAPAMAEMQEQVLGEVIKLNGQDLADLVAFAHDEAEQEKLEPDQIPARYRDLIVR